MRGMVKDVTWNIASIGVQAKQIYRPTKTKIKKQTCSGNTHLELIPPKHLQHINILHVREDKKCHTYLEFYLIDI